MLRCIHCGWSINHPDPMLRRSCTAKEGEDCELEIVEGEKVTRVPRPGLELRRLIQELGLKEHAGCRCAERARQMDLWGVEGCRENRATIIGWLEESAAKANWLDTMKVAARGYLSVESLLDEALRRAEQQP